MDERAGVVIVGAGVIGCSTAYHLARAGLSDVVIVERGQVGSGSSSKSAAMLALQFCSDELTLQMARYSYARFQSFSEEVGASIDFHPTGWIYVATEESAPALRMQVALLNSRGVTSELLKPAELHELYPELNVSDVALASWGPDDGPLDPHMVMWGYLRRAREMGVRLYENTLVTGIDVDHGRVKSVQTNRGAIACDIVVNAAGPWALEVGRLAGVHVPIENSARTIVVTDALPDIPPDRPFVEDLSTEWYFRPEVDGILMGMGLKPVRDADDVGLDDEQIDEMIDVAVHRVPALARASVLTAWTGVRPLTADGLPIIGRAPEVEGLLLNCGWGGVGIMMAPVAGQMLSELIAHGEIRVIEADALQLSRFGRQSASPWK